MYQSFEVQKTFTDGCGLSITNSLTNRRRVFRSDNDIGECHLLLQPVSFGLYRGLQASFVSWLPTSPRRSIEHDTFCNCCSPIQVLRVAFDYAKCRRLASQGDFINMEPVEDVGEDVRVARNIACANLLLLSTRKSDLFLYREFIVNTGMLWTETHSRTG